MHLRCPSVSLLSSLVLAVAAGCTVVSGCDFGPRFVGSGISKSEPRAVQAFEGVELTGTIGAEVQIGEPAKVELTADDNLLAHIQTAVENGKLTISFERGNYSTKVKPIAHIVVPALKRFAITGAADGTIGGIARGELETSISGTGNLRVGGEADSLTAVIQGTGNIDATGLKATRAKASIKGVGNIDVSASEALEVSIAGAGKVSYRGNPKLTQSIAGAGSVKKLD